MIPKMFDGSNLIIQFPRTIVESSFESILKTNYFQSFDSAIDFITFDFKYVEWCDIFELSILSLWILELKNNNKSVKFIQPTSRQLKLFLASYGFNAFLLEYKIQNTNNPIDEIFALDEDSPIFPLTFFTDSYFSDVFNDLSSPQRYNTVLKSVEEAEFVKNGAIKDIVLKELIDNLYYHTKDHHSNIIMTRIKRRDPQFVSQHERSFFTKLRGGEFLTLVISDQGKGIHNKLKSAYIEDSLIPNRSIKPDDTDILEYSFNSHSTSRSLEERVGEIYEILESQEKEFPPDTGLFRLREIVREYSGLLYVRSGKGIICYDFLSDSRRVVAKSNPSAISPIGGTQFKVHFPIDTPKKSITLVPQLSRIERRKYSYLPIQDFIPDTNVNEADVIQKFTDEFVRLSLDSPRNAIIIDFENTNVLSSKALHFILFRAVQKQTSTTPAIAINLDNVYKDPPETVLSQMARNILFFHPLTILGKTKIIDSFGISRKNSRLLLELSNTDNQTEEMRLLAAKYNQLFELNPKKDCFEFSHSISELIHFARLNKQKQIITAIEKDKVFNSSKRVLLPSKVYCEGYFEVRKLFGNPCTKKNISTWLTYWLFELKIPNFIISISNDLAEIAQDAIDSIKQDTGFEIRHISFNTPVKDEDLFNLVYSLKLGEKGIIFSEVVGSSKTLQAILRYCPKSEIVGVLTIVNAIQNDSEPIEHFGKKLIINAVLEHSLNFSSNLLPNWRYSNVYLVDENTHLLIPPFKFDKPLWKPVVETEQIIKSEKTNQSESILVHSNTFFEDCVIPESLFYENHFSNDGNHLIYYYDISKLAKRFGHEIGKIITKVVQTIHTAGAPPVTHIAYLEKNPGVDQLAREICLNFAGSVPYPISNEILLSEVSDKTIQMKTVIVIDDAIVTGDTLIRIYDLLDRLGASNIFAFTLINRGSEYSLRRFKKITRYGNAIIESGYLADARISNYSSANCPICLRIRELNQARECINDSRFTSFIDALIRELEEIPVNRIADLKKNNSNPNNLVIRWKLELARDSNFNAIRKELTTILKSFPTDQSALYIIKVLHREKNLFILDEQTRKTIFYGSFTREIVNICWFFIEHIEEIDAGALEDVFYILSVFDTENLMEELSVILKQTLSDEQKFFRLLLQLFLIPESYESPSRLRRIFKEFSNLGLSQEISKTCDRTYQFWKEEEDKLSRWKNERIQNYKDLTGGVLHEQEHIMNALTHSIDRRLVPEIIANWYSFHSEVSKVAPLVRGCIENVSDGLAENLTRILREIKSKVNDGNELINRLEEHRIEFNDKTKNEFVEIVENINRLFNVNGLEHYLEFLRTDLRLVISRTLKSYESDIRKINLEVEKKFPEDACIVFGEYAKLTEIFGNLIKNAVEWSNATKLLIQVEMDPVLGLANISFIDNGIGLKSNNLDDSLFDYGFATIKKIARENSGDFEILKLNRSNKILEVQRGNKGSHVKVLLPYFKVKA
jgi:signal transduction histidine kinase/adenine/guanine phosphoribosyltransferase-like PRPP-binding protein